LLNGRPIQVSKIADLTLATIGTDWNRTGQARQMTLDTVKSLVHDVDAIPCYNSAALALAWVAIGRIDGYFNFSLMPWDVAAASLLLQQSGGLLSDIAGQPISLNAKPISCLASNGRLHAQLLKYMPW
jgi:myo-inositol-1(or 4)-monophosphatase